MSDNNDSRKELFREFEREEIGGNSFTNPGNGRGFYIEDDPALRISKHKIEEL